jgi:hypothetical protein
MSYQRLKAKEQQLTQEIEALVAQAKRCDKEEDQAYQDKTGYEIPEDLKFKQERLDKIKAAKEAIEHREALINPGKEIDGKKQISFADTDARIMGKKGDFDYRYNAQISVDADFQIIVGQHISLNANDKNEVLPALEALQETTGRLPDMMSLDNGYMSGDNLDALEKSTVDAYIATDKGEKQNPTPLDESERKLTKADFTYHKESNSFTCPGEQTLNLVRKSKDGDQVYQGSAEVCAKCPYQSRCCESKKGEARTITTDDKEPLRQAMSEDGKAGLKTAAFEGLVCEVKKKWWGSFLCFALHTILKLCQSHFYGSSPSRIQSFSGNCITKGKNHEINP